MVFLVQEVNLVGKFTNGLLIHFMSMSDREGLQVLSTLIESLESFNFLLSYDNLLLNLLKFVLDLALSLLSLIELVAESVGSHISFGQILEELTVNLSKILVGAATICALHLKTRHITSDLVHSVTQFKVLLVTANSGHQVKLTSLKDIASEAFYDLVLRWKVHLRQSLLKFSAHLSELAIKGFDLGVLSVQ